MLNVMDSKASLGTNAGFINFSFSTRLFYRLMNFSIESTAHLFEETSVTLNPTLVGFDLEFTIHQYAAASFDPYPGKPIESAKNIAARCIISRFGGGQAFQFHHFK